MRLDEIHRGINLPVTPITTIVDGPVNNMPIDLVSTSNIMMYIVSDKLVQVLKDNNFSGWSTYPISVIRKDGSEMGGYHGFAITGRCGSMSYTDELVEFVPPPNAWYRRKGLVFEPESWDGSDIFKSDDTQNSPYVTEEVKLAFETAGLTNLRFEKFSEILEP